MPVGTLRGLRAGLRSVWGQAGAHLKGPAKASELAELRQDLEEVRRELRSAEEARDDFELQLYVLRAHHQRTVRVADEARMALNALRSDDVALGSLETRLGEQISKSAILAPPPHHPPATKRDDA